MDALFKLPLAEFTGARNDLAARLKREGRANDSNFVKALAKPSISAWAVNQLHWNHRVVSLPMPSSIPLLPLFLTIVVVLIRGARPAILRFATLAEHGCRSSSCATSVSMRLIVFQ